MRAAETVLETPRVFRGLLAAAIGAWLFMTLIGVAVPAGLAFLGAALATSPGPVPRAAQIMGALTLALVYGLPVTILLSFAAGYPTWRLAISRGKNRRRDAVRYGVGAGVAVAALLLVASVAPAFLYESRYNAWSGGIQTVRDGLPTLYGLGMTLAGLAFVVAAGAIAGLCAWQAGGKKIVR